MFSGCPSACVCLPGQRHSPAGLLLTPSFGMSFAIEDSYLVLDGVGLGLPDLPYFTGDPVFQTLSSASRGGGSRREEQISRILLVRLSRHFDT